MADTGKSKKLSRKERRWREIAAVTTPPEGRKLVTAPQMARRDEMIAEDMLSGMGRERVAKTYGVTIRRVTQIMAEYRDLTIPQMKGRDPLEIVWKFGEHYEAWIAQLAEIAADADQDSARVGAINAQAAIQQKQIDLLQASGILPKNLGTLRTVADVRFLAMRIVEVFEKHSVPPEAMDELRKVLQGASGSVN